MRANDYYKEMMPYAKIVEGKTGIHAPLVVAFWSWETDFGTNRGSRDLNNHGGIKENSRGADYKDRNGAYAGYHSIENFARDYARVLHLSYYRKVLSANQNDWREVTHQLNLSPYAEADYNINTIIKRANEAKKYSSGGYDTISNIPVSSEIIGQVSSMSEEERGKIAVVGLVAALFLLTK